jgi:glycosyltransferase involved in cell wall biosynthesis
MSRATSTPLRIAQIAPQVESVPPHRYGGTERVIASLTEELVRRGHQVTLFASGDSRTSAELVSVVPRSLRRTGVRDARPYDLLALSRAFERAQDFDVIHSHIDYPALPFARFCPTPTVITCHGRLDLLDVHPLFEALPDAHLVSISDNQRRLVPDWHWAGTVYNGIDLSHFTFHPRPGSYLAFLGRISPEKGIEDAVAVAKLAGVPLKVAAKIDPVDDAYYQERIKPLFAHTLVEYVGEVTEQEKDGFLGQAMAVLFPVRWPEPFGLVMAEAMATGTPVIAGRFGSVPEVVLDGVTGFIGDSVEEMALAVRRLAGLDRTACRRHVEQRFATAQMAAGYEAIYQQVLERQADYGPTDTPATAAAAAGAGDIPRALSSDGVAARRGRSADGWHNGAARPHDREQDVR